MIKRLSILFIFFYSLLLSGSMLSVGHSFLHATSSITGIHQHGTDNEIHSHAHSHHVSDHGSIFKSLFNFSTQDKKFLTDISFILFYYEPTYELNSIISSEYSISYFNNSIMQKSLTTPPGSPPPDLL